MVGLQSSDFTQIQAGLYSTNIKPEKWVFMYRGSDLASVSMIFSIGFWNSSDSMVF